MAMYGTIFSEVNANRVVPLIRDPALDRIAVGHSKWMAGRRLLCHEGVTTRYVQMAQRGYTSAKAENVWASNGNNNNNNNIGAAGGGDPARAAVEAWIQNPGHYKNLSNPAYTHTGIGIAGGVGGTPYYITQIFGTSSDPLLKKRLRARHRQSHRQLPPPFGGGGGSRALPTNNAAATATISNNGHTSSSNLPSSPSSCVEDHANAFLHDVLLRDERGERGPALLGDYKRAGEMYMEALRRRRQTTAGRRTDDATASALRSRLEMLLGRAEELKNRKDCEAPAPDLPREPSFPLPPRSAVFNHHSAGKNHMRAPVMILEVD